MPWTDPYDYTPGQILTAANLDTYLSDNMRETAPAKVTTAGDTLYATGANAIALLAIGPAGAWGMVNPAGTAPSWGLPAADFILTEEDTSGTDSVYQDLATVGPSVTVTVPSTGKLLLLASASIRHSAADESGIVGYKVGAAATVDMFQHISDNASDKNDGAACRLVTGLTPGSNTIKLQYKSSNNQVSQYGRRSLIAIPVNF